MKHKKHAKVFSMLCILAMVFMLIPPGITVCAAESYEPLQTEIPYKHIYTTTDTTVDSVFHYVITGKDGAPLPAEVSERGLFSVNGISGKGIKDRDNKVFNLSGTLTFTFTKPGVYVYELKADHETDSKKTNASRYTFESDIITVILYVTNSPDNGLNLQSFTAENSSNEKLSEIRLKSAYKSPVKSISNDFETSVENGNKDNLKSWTPFKTGDSHHILLYVLILGISGVCIIVMMIKLKK